MDLLCRLLEKEEVGLGSDQKEKTRIGSEFSFPRTGGKSGFRRDRKNFEGRLLRGKPGERT